MEYGLQGYEVGEYSDYCCGRGYHDDEPEVELRFGPHEFPFPLEHADEDFVGHCGGEEWVGWRRWLGIGGGGRRVLFESTSLLERISRMSIGRSLYALEARRNSAPAVDDESPGSLR